MLRDITKDEQAILWRVNNTEKVNSPALTSLISLFASVWPSISTSRINFTKSSTQVQHYFVVSTTSLACELILKSSDLLSRQSLQLNNLISKDLKSNSGSISRFLSQLHQHPFSFNISPVRSRFCDSTVNLLVHHQIQPSTELPPRSARHSWVKCQAIAPILTARLRRESRSKASG